MSAPPQPGVPALDARTTHESRESCHDRRDAYYACAHAAGLGGAAASAAAVGGAGSAAGSGVAGPGAGSGAGAGAGSLAAAATCASERAAYDGACPRSWTKYWDQRFKLGRPLLVVPRAVLDQ